MPRSVITVEEFQSISAKINLLLTAKHLDHKAVVELVFGPLHLDPDQRRKLEKAVGVLITGYHDSRRYVHFGKYRGDRNTMGDVRLS